MTTKAQRAFAYVDSAAGKACADGSWMIEVDWSDYESIQATHVTRRIRGWWAIDLAVTIEAHWHEAGPVTHERTIKFGLDWPADHIEQAVSDSIWVTIQAERQAEGGDGAAAVERINRQRFMDVLMRAGRR